MAETPSTGAWVAFCGMIAAFALALTEWIKFARAARGLPREIKELKEQNNEILSAIADQNDTIRQMEREFRRHLKQHTWHDAGGD